MNLAKLGWLALAFGAMVRAMAAETGPSPEVLAAFAHLSSHASIPTFCGNGTTQDWDAMRMLSAHPQETQELIVAALSKGGRRGGRDPSWMVRQLLSREKALSVIRQVVATYPIGDPETPLLGYLAGIGEAQDMKRLRREIVYARNSMRGVHIAEWMALNNRSPYTPEALGELRRHVPGYWQETPDMKAFFLRTGVGADDGEPAVPYLFWPTLALAAWLAASIHQRRVRMG